MSKEFKANSYEIEMQIQEIQDKNKNNTGTAVITTNITTGSEASAPTKLIINKLN